MKGKAKFKSKNSKIEIKKLWIGWVVLLLTDMVSGQSVLSKIPASGASYSAFVPSGYDTLAIARGDLNNDKLEDLALVLRSVKEVEKDADPNVEPPGRILVILFKSPEGYKTAAKSDSVILCAGCGGIFGDPFADISINRNVITINHYGGSAWRWELTHRFRYQQNDFYLIGETNYSYWNVKMCDKLKDFAGTNLKDVNYLTGQFEEKEITEECKLKVNKKGKRKVEPLKKLSDFSIEN
jgi:hypothetical protein